MLTVERDRAPLRRQRPAWTWALACASAAIASGCAFVPKSKLDDAHKLVQSLRSENAQMKDVALNLKLQNQDLTQRAVDDARSIAALEAATDRYERSIQGYQGEREQMRAAFQDIKAQTRDASSP